MVNILSVNICVDLHIILNYFFKNSVINVFLILILKGKVNAKRGYYCSVSIRITVTRNTKTI